MVVVMSDQDEDGMHSRVEVGMTLKRASRNIGNLSSCENAGHHCLWQSRPDIEADVLGSSVLARHEEGAMRIDIQQEVAASKELENCGIMFENRESRVEM
jgi:hypothetical protein